MMGNVNEETAREMYNNVKKTGLYDEKLAMYKTSASIEGCSMEAGRCRAFTPGWQERENVFLHMEYKYILSMIRAGICPEFTIQLQEHLFHSLIQICMEEDT